MSTARQSDLLAGEQWTALYTAFTQVNFNATDPVSINTALRQYVQQNYPESFNDWIVSSEFVAIIDLLAWLAGTLAYKTDLAARENFIDTAESRASILRLARFLSYNPSRCRAATGVLKITQVATDDDVYDSYGTDLANTKITWNDPNNVNWQEQFTAILNNAFSTTNPFGIPLSEGIVSGIATQLYRINGLANASSLSFSATVSGIAMPFEVCNGDFTDGGTLYERDPNPANALQLYFLNDSNGNASAQTGFFLLFKQGSTTQQVFNITVPVENQLLDLGAININQTDVWVDTVDDNGVVLIDWTKVPSMFNSNITYNAIPLANRNIFAALTRDNDQVTIRFADGNFGLAPVGNIAVTYRTSNGLAYTIQPSEIANITLPITFINSNGVSHLLYLTFGLAEPVANSAAAETIEQIRQRAPQVYATQNRMVSGEDYNTYPLSSNLAVKIKAVNRIYSGQSRYIDLHDPTGTYQDLSIFGDDGIFFRDIATTYFEVPSTLNKTALQIYADYILPAINQSTITDLIRDVILQHTYFAVMGVATDIAGQPLLWSKTLVDTISGWFSNLAPIIVPGTRLQVAVDNRIFWVTVMAASGAINLAPPANTAGPVILSTEVPDGAIVLNAIAPFTPTPASNASLPPTAANGTPISWTQSTADLFNTTGNFSASTTVLQTPGTMLQFWCNNQTFWVAIVSITGVVDQIPTLNTAGPVTLSQTVATGAIIMAAIPAIDTIVPTMLLSFNNVQVSMVNDYLANRLSFSLLYDYATNGGQWVLGPPVNDFGSPPPALVGTQLLIGFVNYVGGIWRVNSRGLRYVFESLTTVQWYDNGRRDLAQATGEASVDSLRVLRINSNLNDPRGYALGMDYDLTIARLWLYPDGTPEVRRTTVSFADSNGDGVPDQPDLYYNIVSSIPTNTYLFWSNAANPPYDQPLYSVIGYDTDLLMQRPPYPAIGTVGFQLTSTLSYLLDATFWVYQGLNGDGTPNWVQDVNGTYRMETGRGPNTAARWVAASGSLVPAADQLAFHWKHYAASDFRIDPASTNIIDIFVLTYSYDAAVRQWIANGANPALVPLAPSELDLSLAFSAMETVKMFSDTIVWRPVSYKFLFGAAADISLQAKFKVVRAVNSAVSDGQIQSRILAAINNFFAISNWDFAETFYFTELAAYIHQQLVGLISSVVIVPVIANGAFGDIFEISCGIDEIFISVAQVSDIVLIPSNTAVNLRIVQ